MRFLQNKKINQKFVLLFGVIALGIVMIAAAYSYVISVQDFAEGELQAANDYQEATKNTRESFFTLNILANEFFLTSDLKVLERFYNNYQLLQKRLIELRSQSTALGKKGNSVDNVLRDVDEFIDQYKLATDAVVELGINQDIGLRGRMRQFVNSAEQEIKTARSVYLDRSMLLMRRHEKNFLVRRIDTYADSHTTEYAVFRKLLSKERLPAENIRTNIAVEMQKYRKAFLQFTSGIRKVAGVRELTQQRANTALASLDELAGSAGELIEEVGERQQDAAKFALALFGLTLLLVAIMITAFLYFLTKDITMPMRALQAVIHRVNSGDISARTKLFRNDEIGEVGKAFDMLLDQRISALQQAEADAESLNDSIIRLIRAVKVISDKDFSLKIPVSEDITGAVSDSLNLLVDETSKIIADIRRVSGNVSNVSNAIKQQADTVIQVADFEREQIEDTASNLEASSKAIASIAEKARSANKSADATIQTTSVALNTVNKTIDGINGIRTTISETEKRMKRLGERSQEITGIVSVINTIAERTHTLALNASMHAASAGVAGQGFAVVAEEVQRLAESAREATSEISTLVNNIQVETSDTVHAMNEAISNVADGTKLAEEAGKVMEKTQKSTAELVSSVQEISIESTAQAEATELLRSNAANIKASTYKTSQELEAQNKNTKALVIFSNKLKEAVAVFTLPEKYEGNNEAASELQDAKNDSTATPDIREAG